MTKVSLTNEDIEEIRFQAFNALNGADATRQKLLRAISVGSTSLEDEAYAIKCRVKSVESLVNKVIGKRLENKTYKPSDATDIIGLRILVLFKKELPQIISSFLYFIDWAQKSPFNLFLGQSIHEAIKEIIIYPRVDSTDSTLDLCRSAFSAFGFYDETRLEQFPDLPHLPVTFKIEEKNSKYSSIHIVLLSDGRANGTSRNIPIEVQIRTSTEDVWGEIDHRHRYKSRENTVDDHLKGHVDPFAGQIEKLVLSSLQAMKGGLDSISDQADNIDEYFYFYTPEKLSVQNHHNNLSLDIDYMRSFSLQGELQENMEICADKLKNIYSELRDSDNGMSNKNRDRLHKEFLECLKLIGRLRDDVVNHEGCNDNINKIQYHLVMEEALALFWMAVLKSDGTGVRSRGVVENYLRLCMNLYGIAMKITGYSTDPVLAFRIASVWEFRGRYHFVRAKLKEAVGYLDLDGWLPQGHYLRARIPRQYGIALWEAGEEVRRDSLRFGGSGFLSETQLKYYLRALDVTRPLLNFVFLEDTMDQLGVSSDDERIKIANNVVEYCTCFLANGGNPASLNERGLCRSNFANLVASISPRGFETVNVYRADTIREAALFLGDIDLAAAAAARVLDLVDRGNFTVFLPNVVYDEMRADAQATLDGQRKVRSIPTDDW